jgi:hypothetical protein
MYRVLKCATPVVALALLLCLNTAARAEESAGKGGKGVVSGIVLDQDGKPASGVMVRLFHPFERGPGKANPNRPEKQAAEDGADPSKGDKPANGDKPAKGDQPAKGDKPAKGDRPKPVATATTDANGKFEMGDVPAGEYMVVAMVRGQSGARQPIHVKAGETAKVELKLKYRERGPGGQPGKPGEPGAKKGPKPPTGDE